MELKFIFGRKSYQAVVMMSRTSTMITNNNENGKDYWEREETYQTAKRKSSSFEKQN